jgi:hypothetical protein
LSVFTPIQIRHAYGFDQISFSASGQMIAGDGAGQTIAIVDAFDDPNIASDLRHFDRAFNLPDPVFTKSSPSGVLPPADAGWAQEISLDVEWAHAIAPGASILLVEAASDRLPDLLNAVSYAAQQPGVDVVSMSWGVNEFAGQTNFDKVFTTPAGHTGVTFVASSGDNGASAGVSWPASSPNVLSVGGTTLRLLDSTGSYGSESGFSGSTGGRSSFEPEPSWQLALQNSGARTTPDVAYVGNPRSGVYIYDSYMIGGQAGWFSVGGTSVGAPQWAALIAIADQGLALSGEPSLDGPHQTLPALYSLSISSSVYLHDVTPGFPGDSALPSYNLVTGLGSPRADALVSGLVTAGGGGNVVLASPTLVVKVRNPGTPQNSGPVASANTASAADISASTVQLLFNEHVFPNTPAGIVVGPSTGESGAPTPGMLDPSVTPLAGLAPHFSQSRVESGGGNNALLATGQDDDLEPMLPAPSLPDSGGAPSMAPAAATVPAPEVRAPMPPAPVESAPLSAEGELIESSGKEIAVEPPGDGAALKALAAAAGLWLVLGTAPAWTRTRGSAETDS